jgi:hypothetical protein
MPTPGKKETQKDFVSRCIPIRQKEHPGEDPKQSSAICNSIFRKEKGYGVQPKGKKK